MLLIEPDPKSGFQAGTLFQDSKSKSREWTD